MREADAEALVRLIQCQGAVAPRRALLETHGSPSAALAAGATGWRAAGLDARQIEALRRPEQRELTRTLHWLAASEAHHLLGWHDPDYPALLRRIGSPPLALFVAGDPARLWHPGVAVVGSRSPTAGGLDHAREFAGAFVADGLSVISGMAAGIDTAAHRAALDRGGLTVAVLGCGIDIAYPRGNAALQREIAARGAVVSEHAPGTVARREHFPSRNRIIAGLALGTVVVEAALRSGALITARLAADAGREVFAIPGSIRNPRARGCHRLIRDGAGLVELPAEVVATLAPLAAELGAALRGRLKAPSSGARHTVERDAAGPLSDVPPDDPDYHRLWQALGHDPTDMDRLVAHTGLTTANLSAMLLLMELEGRVVAEHGRYARKSQSTMHDAPAGAGRGK